MRCSSIFLKGAITALTVLVISLLVATNFEAEQPGTDVKSESATTTEDDAMSVLQLDVLQGGINIDSGETMCVLQSKIKVRPIGQEALADKEAKSRQKAAIKESLKHVEEMQEKVRAKGFAETAQDIYAKELEKPHETGSADLIFNSTEELAGTGELIVSNSMYYEAVNLSLPQVVFLADSQASEAGLDLIVEHMLNAAGFQATLLHDSAQRLVRSSKPALSTLKGHCNRMEKKPDVLAMWMGLNDLKVKSLQGAPADEGANYKKDLTSVLAAIQSFCGSPKVLLVRPPLFVHKRNDIEWPNAEVPKMVEATEGAYGAIKQSRHLAIVDAQALANSIDFDRTGHFCTDKRACQTTSVLSKAIVKAVEHMMNEPVIPGLSFTQAVEHSNTSSWLKLLAASSVPMLGLEGVVYAFRSMPTLYSNDQDTGSRTWLPLFDIARLLGVLHIAAFHLFQEGHPWCGFGKYWLSFFFFTSGFTSSYSTRSDMPGPIASVKHGLSKTYLTHAIGIVIFLAAQWGDILMAPWYDVLTTVTLTQSILPPFHSSLNGPAWFLSTLMVFWCLAPHWHKFLGRITQGQRMLLLAFCWISMLMPALVCFGVLKLNLDVGGDVPQLVEFHFTQRWQTFLGGMVFEYSLRGQKIGSLTVTVAMLLLFMGLGGIAHISPPGFTMGRHYLLFDHGFATFPLFCAFALLALAFHSTSASTITKWAGLLAFPIFILHVPVRALAELLGLGVMQYVPMLLCSAVAAVWMEQYRASSMSQKAATPR